MSARRLTMLIAIILLAACRAPLQTFQIDAAVALLPTASISRVAPTAAAPAPIPSHAYIDKAVLDDLAATPQPNRPRPATPTPTAEPPRQRAVTRIVIDAIKLDRALTPVGLDADRMPIVPKHDPAWYISSAVPGEGENIVLWAHALRFRDSPDIPAPFGRISKLKLGARIEIYDAQGAPHSYTITRQVWVTPDKVKYILPQGREMLTLVSCIGDQVIGRDGAVVDMSHRLITIAEPSTP